MEKRIMGLEKKYKTGEFAAGNGPGACKLEGNRVGVFMKGKGCQPIPEEPEITAGDAAKDAAALASAVESGSGSGSGSGSEGAAESEAGKHATDGEGKSDKPKLSLKQIEERIAKLESTTL